MHDVLALRVSVSLNTRALVSPFPSTVLVSEPRYELALAAQNSPKAEKNANL